MIRQPSLALDDPTRPVPTRPTLIHFTGGAAWVDVFDDVAALAAAAVQLAGDAAGFRLAAEASTCATPGFELFKAFSLYALTPPGDNAPGEEWLGSCAVQTTPRDRLAHALTAAWNAAHPQAKDQAA